MNLPKWFYSFSLKQRISLAFVLLITCGLLATGSIAYLIAAKEIQRNAFQSSQDTVSQSAQIVNERLRNIGTSIRSLMFSNAFKDVLTDVQNADKSNYYKSLTALQAVFSQVKFNDLMIDSILIATPNGDFYPTSSARNTSYSFYNSEFHEQFKELKHGYWSKGHVDEFFTGNQRVISLIVEGVNDSGDKSTNVFVVVNVKEDDLVDLFMENLSQQDKQYFLIDSQGENVISAGQAGDRSWMHQPEFIGQLTEQTTGSFFYNDLLINYTRLEVKEDWMIVGIQSKDQLLAKLNGIKRATTYVMISFVILSLLLTNNLTSVLLKPLNRLQKLMRRVEENDLTVRFNSPYKDEISQVGFRFNSMLDEIQQLIDDVKTRERDKRKAEIKALSAQMDPHFFYNTLNTIYCKSVLGENDDVNEMILALSQMFQLSLSGGRDLITLRDELDHVQQYLAIQQRSYENLFECRIEADPEVLDCLIPKIVIQPLVENSIHHGFRNRKTGGKIQVTAHIDDDSIKITVEDNGEGLDPAKIQHSLQTPTTSKKGYALRNIYHRLQLYFGDKGRMEISNNNLGGARIECWIPLDAKGDANHDIEPTATA